MSGKGSNTPPPAMDPSIGQSQQQMANLAKQEWDTFTTQMYPQLQQQMNTQTQNASNLSNAELGIMQQNQGWAQGAQNQVQHYLYPLQAQMANQAAGFNSPGFYQQQSENALSNINSTFAAQNQAQKQQMMSYGVNPTSGNYQGMWNANRMNQAASGAGAANQAYQAAQQMGWNLEGQAANALNGNQSAAMGYSSLGLNAGNSSLAAGNLPFQNSLGANSAYNQSAGSAANMYGGAGQLGVGAYNSQLNAWNAQQQLNNQTSLGWGNMFGSLTAAGMNGGIKGFDSSMFGQLGSYLAASGGSGAGNVAAAALVP